MEQINKDKCIYYTPILLNKQRKGDYSFEIDSISNEHLHRYLTSSRKKRKYLQATQLKSKDVVPALHPRRQCWIVSKNSRCLCVDFGNYSLLTKMFGGFSKDKKSNHYGVIQTIISTFIVDNYEINFGVFGMICILDHYEALLNRDTSVDRKICDKMMVELYASKINEMKKYFQENAKENGAKFEYQNKKHVLFFIYFFILSLFNNENNCKLLIEFYVF